MRVYNVQYMASLNATAVAHKVVEKVRKGEKVNLGKIILSQGYARGIATHPHKVTRTKSYKAVIQNVTGALEKERARIIETMSKKDLSAEKYGTLVQSADIITKNIQLLSGKATENVAMVIEVSEAIAKKNTPKENTKAE